MTQIVPKESSSPGKWRWLAAAAIFALCVGPTYISYRSYEFEWDDTDYMERAVAVSRAFWSRNLHGIGTAMISIRPPVMTFMGLPWGSLTSWDSIGNCFITLAAATSLLAALCLYLLLRIGVKPFFLALASLCVFAAIGPYPAGARAHAVAAGFYADSLFAWTALAAMLLIPYEARVPCASIRSAILRGILWGSIFSLGVLTKLNFFYFVALAIPILFGIRVHREGLRLAVTTLITCAFWSAPAAFYLLRWGRLAFEDAKASSFGKLSGFFYTPLPQYLGDTVRNSPGMLLSLVLTIAALTYLVIRRRSVVLEPEFLALLITIGFGLVVLASSNREIRYSFPVIAAVPFLLGVLLSGKENSLPGKFAVLVAGMVFCSLALASLPTRYRAERQESLGRSDAVLAQAATCNAQHILIATDSPTFNKNLMDLAEEFSAAEIPAETDTLSYRAVYKVPIEEDFHAIDESDIVVFQDTSELGPPFTNQRVAAYQQYVRQRGYVPVRLGSDLSVYSVRCKP